MPSQLVSCGSIVQSAKYPFIIYHQQLGCFHSDWHQHEWGQLIYAERGCIHLHCHGQKRLLPSWYALWIPPGTEHEIWSESPQLYMRSICLPLAATDTDLIDQLAVFPISILLRELVIYSERWNRMEQDAQEQAVPFLSLVRQLLPDQLCQAVPICLPATRHPKLKPVVTYIHQELVRPLSQQEVAAHVGLSVRTLSRLFAQQLGTTFTTYCQTARILKALELIEAGQHNVSQLADAVGYETLAAFSNMFLTICGCRPSIFIKSRTQS